MPHVISDNRHACHQFSQLYQKQEYQIIVMNVPLCCNLDWYHLLHASLLEESLIFEGNSAWNHSRGRSHLIVWLTESLDQYIRNTNDWHICQCFSMICSFRWIQSSFILIPQSIDNLNWFLFSIIQTLCIICPIETVDLTSTSLQSLNEVFIIIIHQSIEYWSWWCVWSEGEQKKADFKRMFC